MKKTSKIKLEEFKNSAEEFIKEIDTERHACFKKLNGRKIIHLTWVDKDKWFVNKEIQKTNSSEVKNYGGWLVAKDLMGFISYMVKFEGYTTYLFSESKGL